MENIKSNSCPLCESEGSDFYNNPANHYFQCKNCSGIFLDESLLPNRKQEKMRYEEHNNDVKDEGYQNFVSPITEAVLEYFTKDDKGLDFGSGTGPVIYKMLTDHQYSIVKYDPFFHPNSERLQDRYNYIVCCEVMEHFYDPKKEFELLFQLLLPGGKLFCMTDLWDESIDFHSWYYKNDLTHVFIYTKETIRWIRKNFNFSEVKFEGRLLTFIK